MYVEKLRDKYDVTIAEAPDFRGERHIYTLRSIDPVSYTHLDVYKRQALRRASPVPMEIKPVARDTDGFFSIKA